MTRIGRMLIGAFTALLFLGVGGTLLANHRWVFGSVVVGLGLLRAAVLYRQWRAEQPAD